MSPSVRPIASPARRWLVRVVLAAALAMGIGYLPYRVYGPDGVSRALRLKGDLQALYDENRQLNEENTQLGRRIKRLKEDLRAVERVARDELGLVRPTDIIFQFE